MRRPGTGIRPRGDERRKLGLKGGSGRVTGKRISEEEQKGEAKRLLREGKWEKRKKQGKKEMDREMEE